MKKKFLNFMLFGVFTLALSSLFVACGEDYDDDIKRLQEQITANKAANDAALAELKSKIESGQLVTSVAPIANGVKITLGNGTSYDITNGTNGKDGENGTPGTNGTPGSVVTINGDGFWCIDGVSTGYSAKGTPGDNGLPGADGIYYYPGMNKEGENINFGYWVKVDADGNETVTTDKWLASAPSEDGVITAVDYDGTIYLFGEALPEGGYALLKGSDVNAMITGVSVIATVSGAYDYTDYATAAGWKDVFDPTEDPIRFNTAVATQSRVFGLATDPGKITFEAGKAVVENPTATILVKVSPANAVITPEQLSLINTAAGTELSSIVTATNVERYTRLVTRALPTNTGLWVVTFQLDANKILDFESVTRHGVYDNGYVLYALAVENTMDVADRHVMSTFDLAFDATPMTPIKPLDFTVSDDNDPEIPVSTLINRYTYLTTLAGNKTDKRWADPASNFTTPEADTGDDRDDPFSFNYFFTEVGQDIKIKVDGAYAYYAVLDIDGAGGGFDNSVSEKNAWNSYEITGLNKVKKAEDGDLVLRIVSPQADTDEIGIRVFAVNADGTLLDPDGKAFYLICGNEVSGDLLDFKVTFTNAYFTSGFVTSDKVAFSNVSNIQFASVAIEEFLMELGALDLTMANVRLFLADQTTPTNDWALAKFVQLIDLDPTMLTDDYAYNGLFTFKSSIGQPLGRIAARLTKKMPTFPVVIDYKTGQYYPEPLRIYPTPDAVGAAATKGRFDFWNSFNGLVEGVEFYNNIVSPVNPITITNPSAPWNSWPAVVTNKTKIGLQANGQYVSYPMNAEFDFGYISSFTTDPNKAPWTPNWKEQGFDVQFRSYMEDATYTLKTPNKSIVYNQTGFTLNLNQIEVMPPYQVKFNLDGAGGTFGATNEQGNPQRYVDVQAHMFVGTSTIADEYFTITCDQDALLTFTPKSGTSPIMENLPVKLELTITDDFGKVFKKVVGGATFTMTKN